MLFNKSINWELPTKKKYPQAIFGAIRKYDIHTGIDIYVPEKTKVFPLIEGIVINIEWFTGINSDPPTPWWNETQAIWIKDINSNNVFVYGEIIVNSDISIGNKVNISTCIGEIKTVLKKDKGTNPTAMLHIELYSSIPNKTVVWELNSPKPLGLENPYFHIKNLSKG